MEYPELVLIFISISIFVNLQTIWGVEIRRLMTENIESKFMVLGDLNARVGNVPDFFLNYEADRFINHADWYTLDYFNNRRHSKDNTLNKFGKSLIDLCCEMNMHILNGRCKGDEDGEITFVAAQGKSVIDFVIVETELYSYCEHFQIIDYDSDNRL